MAKTTIEPIIADTSGLVCIADHNRSAAEDAARQLAQEHRPIILPAEVFSETIILLGKLIGCQGRQGEDEGGEAADLIGHRLEPVAQPGKPTDAQNLCVGPLVAVFTRGPVLMIDEPAALLGLRQRIPHGKDFFDRGSTDREITVPLAGDVTIALKPHKQRQNEKRLALGAQWRTTTSCSSLGTADRSIPTTCATTLNAWCARPMIRIHDLRHTFVTLALQAGANSKAVSEMIGHANLSITLAVYAHVLPKQRVDVADKVSAVLFTPGLPTAREVSADRL
jgi:Phage integrase family